MPKFLLAYHGGSRPETPEQGKLHMEKWRAWSAGLGEALIDPGMPVGPSKTLSSAGVTNDGGSNPLSGITIIQADTMDQALDMAKTCPHLDLGGTLEVAEGMNMEM